MADWMELNPGLAQLLKGVFTGAVLTHAVLADAAAGTTTSPATALATKMVSFRPTSIVLRGLPVISVSIP
jgi:hypothetical protein